MNLTNYELYNISGGAFSVTMLNAIARMINTVVEFGRVIGTNIRRVLTKSYC